MQGKIKGVILNLGDLGLFATNYRPEERRQHFKNSFTQLLFTGPTKLYRHGWVVSCQPFDRHILRFIVGKAKISIRTKQRIHFVFGDGLLTCRFHQSQLRTFLMPTHNFFQMQF